MSTDYYMVCDEHRVVHYLGFRSTSRWSFGYGKDDDAGRLAIGEWIQAHMDCRPYITTDTYPDNYAKQRWDARATATEETAARCEACNGTKKVAAWRLGKPGSYPDEDCPFCVPAPETTPKEGQEK